ncbi:polysaccharide deacteylase family 2 protein [Ruegeria sp.]|uniref:divergent polysaccharide deacetylase family protein n=1 Tax=Ruegeria sp. TaxID=1879320 RepID=UPI00230E0178|nr:polysaccharide deacteylase family 2 protein [Ruegeria sp.]MDA7963298.1 divergent polysaccharide deacetylase family protein [Ruegeria sp.]
MGGVLGGLITGAVTVLILSVALSMTTPLTRKPQVTTVAPLVATAPVLEGTANMDGAGSEADLVELPPSTPQSPDAQADTIAGLVVTDPQADAEPLTVSAPAGIEAPDQVEAPSISVTAEAPAAAPVQAPTPAAPQQEDGPSEIAEAPPVAIPETEDVAVLDEVEAPEQPAPAPNLAEQPEAQEEDQQIASLQPDPDQPPLIELPQAEAPLQDNPIAVEGEEDTQPRKLPRIAALPQIGGEQSATATSGIGKRVVPLTERDDAPTTQAEAEPVPAGKPIEDYAATFENPEAKPLMSIILIDDEGAYGAEALKDFPYPLSFAVHPSDPEAAEKMARHRQAGFEVLAVADLPAAASAQDAEVSLSVWLDQLPETVGILEGVGTGIQGNRKLADQVAVIAGDTGRGLVTQGRGLNTVQKLAARNGVPSSVVFRDFDGARQDPAVMRRFLDQAAFRAGQDGAVVMLGRLRPETISALLLWGLEDRGGRVAMAPISAVMMNEIQ